MKKVLFGIIIGLILMSIWGCAAPPPRHRIKNACIVSDYSESRLTSYSEEFWECPICAGETFDTHSEAEKHILTQH